MENLIELLQALIRESIEATGQDNVEILEVRERRQRSRPEYVVDFDIGEFIPCSDDTEQLFREL
jgi:hypothetical protein